MNERLFIIVLSGGTDAHREAVQSIVKAHSPTWWHHMPDIWLVEGHDAAYWRNIIKPVLALSKASVLVVCLKEGGSWAYSALPDAAGDWLHDHVAPVTDPAPSKPSSDE